MINIMVRGLPDTVTIGDEPFSVKTDFRVWMRFCNLFEKWHKDEELDIAFVFSDRVPAISSAEDMQEILNFAYPRCVIPKSDGSTSVRVLDYVMDADYIYSAFLGQYGIDLIETELHWHKFRALISGLNSSTRLYEIMGYRCYEGRDKDYIKLRGIWGLPPEPSREDVQAKEEFDNYFG